MQAAVSGNGQPGAGRLLRKGIAIAESGLRLLAEEIPGKRQVAFPYSLDPIVYHSRARVERRIGDEPRRRRVGGRFRARCPW